MRNASALGAHTPRSRCGSRCDLWRPEFALSQPVGFDVISEIRETIRLTAGKLLRSDDLIDDEKALGAALLRENAECGNPHAVRCQWCKQTDMLFRDEDGGTFKRARRGWYCSKCDEPAASQEVKF